MIKSQCLIWGSLWLVSSRCAGCTYDVCFWAPRQATNKWKYTSIILCVCASLLFSIFFSMLRKMMETQLFSLCRRIGFLILYHSSMISVHCRLNFLNLQTTSVMSWLLTKNVDFFKGDVMGLCFVFKKRSSLVNICLTEMYVLFFCTRICMSDMQFWVTLFVVAIRHFSLTYEHAEVFYKQLKLFLFEHYADMHYANIVIIIMAALHSRCGHYIFVLWFLLSFFFFSLPNLSRCRLDVYHTSTHGVALVRI